MNRFDFFVPFDIDLKKSEDGEKRIIQGFASTSAKDRENEEIIQKGLDISDFVNYGWFNWDHDNSKILGYPHKETTRITSEGFYVEGELLKGVAEADRVWEVAVALKKSGAPRKMGFSVEGKVLEKDVLGRVLKAKVYNVAITPNPINPMATWDAVIKSFTECTQVQGAHAGYDFSLNENNSGSSLKVESLDTSLRNLAMLLQEDEEAKKKIEELRKMLLQRNLSKSETILYLQLSKGISRWDAERIVEKYF